jgi:hypothetical protein
MIWPFDPSNWERTLTADKVRAKALPNGMAARIDGGLDRERLLETLNCLGTTVHAAARQSQAYGFARTWEGTPFARHVKSLLDFLAQGEYILEAAEVFGECEEYRGTSDGILRHVRSGNRYLIDFKTWAAYKFLYGLLEGKARSVTDKLEKVSVQLSLYRRMLEPKHGPFHGLLALHVTEHGVTVYPVPYDLRPYEAWLKSKAQDVTESIPELLTIF